MDELALPTTAGALARAFGASLLGDESREVSRLASLEAAGEGALTFFSQRKYADRLASLRGAVLFTSPALARPDLPLTFILVEDPQAAFARVARQFRPRPSWQGVSPMANVDATASVAATAIIAPFAYVGPGACIGANTVIYPHAYVGAEVQIGDGCEIHPKVVLSERVVIGNRVKIFAGSVIGSEGFGLFSDAGGHGEMPQIGTVVIEDDVRVGALVTIDRATFGETRIGRGSKLDDHIHVGHNCHLGRNVILCAQVGLSGSVIVEDDVLLAGQVGIGHGVTIGKGARLGGQSGTSTNLPGGETYWLTPAAPMKEALKIVRYTRKLPQIWARLRNVEKKLGISTSTEGEA